MADEKAPIDYTVLPADVSPTDVSRGARYSAVDFDVPHDFSSPHRGKTGNR